MNDPVTIESTTDSKEAVTAALGKKVEVTPKEETQKELSATEEKSSVETKPDSETGEEVDEEQEELEASPEESAEKAPKKKGGFQKRIDRLNRQKTELAQKNSDLQSRLEHLEREAQKAKPQGETKPDLKAADQSKKPESKDFEHHEQYVEALAGWMADQKVEQKLTEREAKEREKSIRAEEKRQFDAHQARLQEFKKSHDDFDEVLEDAKDIPLSITVKEAILSSDNGPELMYALAQEPEEFRRISALPPIQAARALGILEAKLAGAPQEKKKIETKTTQAPKPMREVGSRAGNPKTIYDDLPYEEYAKMRNAQEGR